jgi:very-short-patch-repair endonuclease
VHKNKLHNLQNLKERRRKLRSEMTPAEAFLWTKLSNGKLDGRKFRRQHSVGSFVVDFYCPAENLSIELDGILHFTEEGIEYDKKRTAYLKSVGINEIRFENSEVFEYTNEVLNKIKACFKKD